MQLTVRDVAAVLKVSENQVYRLVGEQGLPGVEVNGQYRFNRAELIEWATVRKMPMSPAILQDDRGPTTVRLDDALKTGRIVHDLPGTDKESALRALVAALPLPDDFNSDFLLNLFLSREAMGSTAMGNGIAMPHPRYPVVLPGNKPSLTLCFLKQPIQFDALDAKPVHTIFALLCPTVRLHLQLLARLAVALREPSFLEAIQHKASADEIMDRARQVEDAFGQTSTEGK